MSEIITWLVCLWLSGGVINWLITTSSEGYDEPLWVWFIVGLPACALLGPIPILPMLFGKERPK